MDPITTAIIAAVEAGPINAAGDFAKKAIVDGYDALIKTEVRQRKRCCRGG
jgi:hypothetical protein